VTRGFGRQLPDRGRSRFQTPDDHRAGSTVKVAYLVLNRAALDVSDGCSRANAQLARDRLTSHLLHRERLCRDRVSDCRATCEWPFRSPVATRSPAETGCGRPAPGCTRWPANAVTSLLRLLTAALDYRSSTFDTWLVDDIRLRAPQHGQAIRADATKHSWKLEKPVAQMTEPPSRVGLAGQYAKGALQVGALGLSPPSAQAEAARLPGPASTLMSLARIGALHAEQCSSTWLISPQRAWR
jgi:hypothetical protein